MKLPLSLWLISMALYFPATTNYGNICTGFESLGEWEDRCRIFGVDIPGFHYVDAQTEGLPYVYYTPGFAYAQSPYNLYSPHIPGAMIGVDGPFSGVQQYYTFPHCHQEPISSLSFIPILTQQHGVQSSCSDLLIDARASSTYRADGRSVQHGLTAPFFPRNSSKPVSNQTSSLTWTLEGSKAKIGLGKQPLMHGRVSAADSSCLFQGKTSGFIQPIVDIYEEKPLPSHDQLEVAYPASNGIKDIRAPRQAGDKLHSKVKLSRTANDVDVSDNHGPRTSYLKTQLAVKAYMAKAGDTNVLGNINIRPDQYNKDDFLDYYINAKFFVIKSYSEDDIHKSIKYNVWSSTPHGNKKLQSCYEDAQEIGAGKPGGCPIFLFFSVNASGQFCGVAEMIGPVDFHDDMDYWQQDKWSGSFSVKWHIIKDVANITFRNIILENNENKPVTNSRDTQEKQGLEMLKIFKNHPSKTSLLDDFMYYENRQKLMQEEKARLLFKSFRTPLLVPTFDHTSKLNGFVEYPPNKDEKIARHNEPSYPKKSMASATAMVSLNSSLISSDGKHGEVNDGLMSHLKIDSSNISTKLDN